MEGHQQEGKTAIVHPANPDDQTLLPGSRLTAAAAPAPNRSPLDDQKPEDKPTIGECGAFAFCVLPILLVLGIVVYVDRLSYSYNPPKCYVKSVTVSPFNVSSSHITAHWNITFFFYGSNAYTSSYFLHDAHASVLYKDKNISATMIRPIYANVDHKVEADIGVSSAYLNSSIGEAMVADWSLGAVNFEIRVNALVKRIDHERHVEETKEMNVSCQDVTIGFSLDKKTPGTMMGGSRRCE